jgi:ankyrin repeat protein
VNETDDHGYTALHLSAHRPEVVQLLLSSGANPNVQTANNIRPIHLAARAGSAAAIEALTKVLLLPLVCFFFFPTSKVFLTLSGGSRPAGARSGRLDTAALRHLQWPHRCHEGLPFCLGSFHLLSLLLVVQTIAICTDVLSAQVLLEHQANPNAETLQKSTALHLASFRGNRAAISLLIEVLCPVPCACS